MQCRRMSVCLGLASLLLSAVVYGKEQPQDLCAHSVLEGNAGSDLAYRVDWKGMSLDSRRRVEKLADGGWRAVNRSSLLFMGIEESSRFLLDGEQLVSQSYDYQRKGMSKKQNLRLEFAEDGGYKAFSPKGDGEVDSPTPIYDMLNHQMQLRIDLACGEPRSEYSYPIARRNRVSEYSYRRIGEQLIETPVGQLQTLLLERGDPGDKLDRIWLAPELGYLIVRLVHQEDGETAELQLVELPSTKQ